MKFLISILIFVLSAPAALISQTRSKNWAEGQWTGTVYQPTYGTYSLSLSVDPHSKEPFVIDYPSLSCGGNYTLLREDQGTLWLRQDLSYGKEFCVDHVTIALTRVDADHITFSFWYPDDNAVGGYSTLTLVPNL